MTIRILTGDCRERLKDIPDDSVDSCVTDPPYHLTSIVKRFGSVNAAPAKVGKTGAYARASRGFMGQTWDGGDVAFDPDTWREVWRVLKPGAHLVAFSGTRTYHRMVCAIEDAGFEIRDQLAWVYGSGFPKSHDVAKGIDKAAGIEFVASPASGVGFMGPDGPGGYNPTKHRLTRVGESVEAARQWQGWGTALKPSLEPVCFARKPWTNEQEWVTIRSLIEGLWSALWRMLPANDAVKDSTLNPHACGVDLRASAQWSAEQLSNTRATLSEAMDMSRFELALTSSLSTASSWNATLAELCLAESTSTTGTASSTTIDLRTLRFCLSRITPESIILAHRSGAWSSADACSAARYLNATLATLDATRELSALAPAIEREHRDSLDAGATPNLQPIVLARKPLTGTVAENVLEHGTGALNIDGCRVEAVDSVPLFDKANKRPGTTFDVGSNRTGEVSQQGRWPANIIHDGSPEVLAGFPDVTSHGGGTSSTGFWQRDDRQQPIAKGDSGSAARFFYCAKADSSERHEGCHDLDKGNSHPTVKPVDLMRWLCRLVTPKGGTVLDPFMGSGSTMIAADAEQFHGIGCELSPEYAAIAERRIRAAAGMFAEVLAA